MKHDYIIGNPPFSYPKGISVNKKLYVDISHKMFSLLKESGELHFITPQAIISSGQQNKCFKILKEGLIEVNYDADDAFNIGQKVISWIYKNDKNN